MVYLNYLFDPNNLLNLNVDIQKYGTKEVMKELQFEILSLVVLSQIKSSFYILLIAIIIFFLACFYQYTIIRVFLVKCLLDFFLNKIENNSLHKLFNEYTKVMGFIVYMITSLLTRTSYIHNIVQFKIFMMILKILIGSFLLLFTDDGFKKLDEISTREKNSNPLKNIEEIINKFLLLIGDDQKELDAVSAGKIQLTKFITTLSFIVLYFGGIFALVRLYDVKIQFLCDIDEDGCISIVGVSDISSKDFKEQFYTYDTYSIKRVYSVQAKGVTIKFSKINGQLTVDFFQDGEKVDHIQVKTSGVEIDKTVIRPTDINIYDRKSEFVRNSWSSIFAK